MLSAYSSSNEHSYCSANGKLCVNGSCASDKSQTAVTNETNQSSKPLSEDYNWHQLCKGSYLGVKSSIADDLTTKEDLTKVLQHIGLNPSKQLVKQYWSTYNASITFAQFCDITESEKNKSHITALEAFKRLDKEATGTLAYDHLKQIMMTKGEKMSEEEFDNIFGLSPFMKNGHFHYVDFCESVTKTSQMCQKVSLERVNEQEKLYKRNSHTYVVKKKTGKTDNCSSNVPSQVSPALDLIGDNYKNWSSCQSKGCFYFEKDREVINHQFVLNIPADTNIWLTIEPIKNLLHGSGLDTSVFVLKEGDSTARQLISFTEHKDENGRAFLGTRLLAGKYVLLPFTSGCHLQTNTVSYSNKRLRLVKEKKEPSDQVELTIEYQNALKEIFDLVDLDNNGKLSREEFTLFQWQACGEEVQDEEWAALEATFELEDNELTLNGFMDAHLLEAENHDGKEEELWVTLYAMGYNSNLQLENAVPFVVQVYSEEVGSSLHISALKTGGALLEKVICRCAVDRGHASKVRNLNDLIMYTYVSQHHAVITVHNKAHSTVMVRLDCSSSQNCKSHRGNLDFTLKCLPKSVMVGHYLIPAVDKQPWQVNCTESVVK